MVKRTFTFGVSTVLHAAVFGLFLLGRAEAEPAPPSAEGDAGLAETEEPGGEMVGVAIGEEPAIRIRSIGIVDDTVKAAPAPPSEVPPTPQPPKNDAPAPAIAQIAPVEDPPPPAPEPSPAPEPPSTPAEAAAPTGQTDGIAEATPAAEPEPPSPETETPKDRKGHRPPRGGTGKDKCPPPVDTIENVSEARWKIERPFIEYYAKHIPELMKLGRVWTHKGKNGKPDGFKVGLSKCSVLRQGGLRSGDVVHDINGIQIDSVLEAVGAYFKLNREPVLVLNVTRRGSPVTLTYDIEQISKKKKKK